MLCIGAVLIDVGCTGHTLLYMLQFPNPAAWLREQLDLVGPI